MSHDGGDLWGHVIGKLLNLASGLETLEVLDVPSSGDVGQEWGELQPASCCLHVNKHCLEHTQQCKIRRRTRKDQAESHQLAGKTQNLSTE